MSCILPSRCTTVEFGFKRLEMAIQWGAEASKGYTIYRDVSKVQVHNLGIFEHTGRSEAHGLVGLGVLHIAF